MYSFIRYEVEDAVATITLNRPDKLNAWTPAMNSEILHAFEAANADPAVGAIVMTGAGRGFCAGADVSAALDGDSSGSAETQKSDLDISLAWIRMVRNAKPCVAAVNGAAIGIGVTMILSFDVIVASSAAKFGMGFIRMGLSPELASSRLLAHRVGFGRASELCLSGRIVGGAEAHEIGLAEHLTTPEDLLVKAREIAGSFAANPAPQLRMVKQLLSRHVLGADLEEVIAEEVRVLNACRRTPEHVEALAAFMEKRAPDFRKAAGGG